LEIEKIKSVILFITNNLEKRDLHRIFKILYFAEKKHIAKYGRTILNENFIKMEKGPVPSLIYDLFKQNKPKAITNTEYSAFYNAFKLSGYNVTPLESPNMEYISKSNIECLLESISENALLSFNELTEKSHDSAWEKSNGVISEIDMAISEDVDAEFLNYINELSENRNLCLA
jgi:uncharacterized phage-associated protein